MCIFDQLQDLGKSRQILLLFPRLALGHPEKETVRIPKIYILQYILKITKIRFKDQRR